MIVVDNKKDVSYIGIRAVQGRGLADTFISVGVPSDGRLKETLEDFIQVLIVDREYANVPSAYAVIKSGTEPSIDGTMGEPSLEYAACWAQNRQEWVGIKVKRTEIYEGSWQGTDQMVRCEGPFELTNVWGKRILEAYGSSRDIPSGEVLHLHPSQF